MARQDSIIKLNGTIDGISFYKSKDGHLARKAGGVSKARIASDPAFIRTRENGSEFGRAGSAGKVPRTALRGLLQKASDSRVSSRLTAKMIRVVKADTTSDRGLRNVLDGEVEMLQGFEFNGSGLLTGTLFAPYDVTIDRVGGAHQVNLAGFVPGAVVAAPSGATHCKIIAAAASIDFELGTWDVKQAETAFLVLGPQTEAAQTLALPLPAASTHPIMVVLGIEFVQQVNGKMYDLKNGAYNALAIVKVAGI